MPKRIPITAAKEVAEKYHCPQVIIAAWDGELTHIVTYGSDKEQCRQAAIGGDKIKISLGWPTATLSYPEEAYPPFPEDVDTNA